MFKTLTFAIMIFCGSLTTTFMPASAHAKENGANAVFKIKLPKGEKSWTIAEMSAKLKIQTLTVYSEPYKKQMTYQGVWLKDLLKASGFNPADKQGDEVSFTCLDGYRPHMPYSYLNDIDFLVAFQEKGTPGRWHKVLNGKTWMWPAPFYIVGSTAESYKKFPWPLQVNYAEIIRFEEKYPNIFPKNAGADSAAQKGFQTFRTECLTCHSINLEGGDIGPELNVPKNITEYWDESILKQYIRDVSQFRARDKMPKMLHLKTEDIENIVVYLKQMKTQKIQLPTL